MCLNHESESGCKYGDKCKFLHTEAGGQPSKKSKERWRKRIGGLSKETIQSGCVSHETPQRKSILRENGKLGLNQIIKFPKATMRRVKFLEKQCPSLGISQKCEPQERNPGAPKFEERTQDETLRIGKGCFLTQKKRSLKMRSTLLPKPG